MSSKAYKYRMYPNKATEQQLYFTLSRCRELYNAALSERRDAYEVCVKRHPNYYDEEQRKQLTREHAISVYQQKRDLVEIKESRPEYQDIASHVLQDVLFRLDKAFTAFFRRVAKGEQAGYPRFKGRNRYDSFVYPDHAGWKLDAYTRPSETKGVVAVKLHLSKIGTLTVHLHREMEGTIKTLTIKQEQGHWYAIFTCEVEAKPLPRSYEDVGIDLGVTHFAALSHGEFMDSPRYFRRAEKKLVKAQQAASRKKRGSHRRAKAVKQLAKAHRKVRNQRRDFQHKASRTLVNRFQVIVLEDLQVKNLTKAPQPKQDEATGQYLPNGAAAKAGLNKSILDAGWSTFTEMVHAKAASAGRTIILVNPFMTSQLCSGCGALVKKDLSQRWHSCPCGTELDRDTNSAKLILHLGYQQLSGGTRPTSATA